MCLTVTPAFALALILNPNPNPSPPPNPNPNSNLYHISNLYPNPTLTFILTLNLTLTLTLTRILTRTLKASESPDCPVPSGWPRGAGVFILFFRINIFPSKRLVLKKK